VLVLILATMYCLAIVWLISQETRLVFQAGGALDTVRPTFPYQQVDVRRADGAVRYAWLMKHQAGGGTTWVLFLHGNAATIASRLNISHYERLRGLGVSVMAPEYGGFGGLPGPPTERGLDADARAAYDYLRTREGVSAERIVIYGWSLGSAVAVDLASNVPSAAVILEGAPASIVAIGQRQYPIFPIRLLMRNPFESILKIGRVRAPLLFLHSPADTIVPIAEGRRLYDAAPAPKTFVEIPGGHIHASDTDPAAFYGAIKTFLDSQGLIKR
jgi:fermentation-respiration switch protein FrsA (DUF1100 family)